MFRHIILLGFFVACALAQNNPGRNNGQVPPAPVIDNVQQTENGWQVTWHSASSVLIIVNSVRLVDSDGRERHITVRGDLNSALLSYTRPCSDYTVWVKAKSLYGWSPESAPFQFRTEKIDIPPPPTNLSSKESHLGRVLQWKPPVTTAHIRKYHIVGYGNDGEIVEQDASYDSTEAILDSFHHWCNYTVVMFSENLCGTSQPSEEITIAVVSVPHPPHIVGLNDTETSITLHIERGTPEDLVDYYRVNYTGADGYYTVDRVPVNDASVQLTEGIHPCFNYTISVIAVNRIGESKPTVIHWVVRSAEKPETPKLTSIDLVDGKYVAQWDVFSNLSLNSHRIWYSSTGGDKGWVWIPGDVHSSVLGFVHRCNQYKIQMISENKCGFSERSNEIVLDALPLTAPTALADLKAEGTNVELVLTWLAPSSSEHIEEYEIVLVDENGDFRNYWVPPTTNSVIIRGLNAGTTYDIAVTSKNACGWSPSVEQQVSIDASGAISPIERTKMSA